MLSYNLIYLKIMKEEGEKTPKIIIKMNRTFTRCRVHLPFILPDVWHFFSFSKCINKIMNHNDKTGGIKTLNLGC